MTKLRAKSKTYFKLKPGELPKAFAKHPKSKGEALKKGKGYFYSQKNNYVFLHGVSMDWKPRTIARYSPRFPNESEITMYDRLVTGIKDDVDAFALRSPKAELVNGAPRLPVVESKPEPESCPIRMPKPRKIGNLRVVNTPSGVAPLRPKGAKWKQIREWAKDMIEWFEDRGDYLTALGLIHMAGTLELGPKRDRFLMRLRVLYQNEVEAEHALLDRQINSPSMAPDRTESRLTHSESKGRTTGRSGRRERGVADKATPKREREVDRFGTRLGTGTANINAQLSDKPKSKDELFKATGASNVSSHLCRLMREGVVLKTKDDKYYVNPKFKESTCAARSQSQATGASKSKSAGDKSTPTRKRGSDSGARGRGKSPASSSGASRSRKPAKSGRRRSRRA